MDNSLYVGTIEPSAQPSYVSESGSYSSLPEDRHEPKTLSGYYNEAPYTPPEPAAPPENDRKAEALKILYGDKSNTFSSYGTSSSGSSGYSSLTSSPSSYGLGGYGSYNFGSSSYNTTSYGSPVLQSEPVVRHDTNTKPPKIVHSDLPEIVYPAEKDISGQLVGGEIINGDDLSAQLDRNRKQHSDDTERETPPAPAFNTKKLETEDLQPKQAADHERATFSARTSSMCRRQPVWSGMRALPPIPDRSRPPQNPRRIRADFPMRCLRPATM